MSPNNLTLSVSRVLFFFKGPTNSVYSGDGSRSSCLRAPGHMSSILQILCKQTNFNNVLRRFYTHISFLKCGLWIDLLRIGQQQGKVFPHYLGK